MIPTLDNIMNNNRAHKDFVYRYLNVNITRAQFDNALLRIYRDETRNYDPIDVAVFSLRRVPHFLRAIPDWYALSKVALYDSPNQIPVIIEANRALAISGNHEIAFYTRGFYDVSEDSKNIDPEYSKYFENIGSGKFLPGIVPIKIAENVNYYYVNAFDSIKTVEDRLGFSFDRVHEMIMAKGNVIPIKRFHILFRGGKKNKLYKLVNSIIKPYKVDSVMVVAFSPRDGIKIVGIVWHNRLVIIPSEFFELDKIKLV